jgi:hypothetical protein
MRRAVNWACIAARRHGLDLIPRHHAWLGARAHPAPWLELEPPSGRHGWRAKLAPRIRPPCPASHCPAPAGHHFHKLARAHSHLLEHPCLPVTPTKWRRMASMWLELVPSNGGDHSNPHLRVYFLLDLTQTHLHLGRTWDIPVQPSNQTHGKFTSHY